MSLVVLDDVTLLFGDRPSWIRSPAPRSRRSRPERLGQDHAAQGDPPDGDAVRAAYGEIVDRYRDEPASLAIIKPLGDEIRKLEASGNHARRAQ
jgi:hypothetical protein